MGRNGNVSVRRYNKTCKPSYQLVVYHISESDIQYLILTGPTQKEPPKPRLMTMEEIDSDEHYDPNNDK